MPERILKRPLKEAVERVKLRRDAERQLAEKDGMKFREVLEDAALTAVVEFGEALLRGDEASISLLAFGTINRAKGYAKGKERLMSPVQGR